MHSVISIFIFKWNVETRWNKKIVVSLKRPRKYMLRSNIIDQVIWSWWVDYKIEYTLLTSLVVFWHHLQRWMWNRMSFILKEEVMIAVKITFHTSTWLGTTTRSKHRNYNPRGISSYKWKATGQKGQTSTVKIHPL